MTVCQVKHQKVFLLFMSQNYFFDIALYIVMSHINDNLFFVFSLFFQSVRDEEDEHFYNRLRNRKCLLYFVGILFVIIIVAALSAIPIVFIILGKNTPPCG